MTHQRRRAVTAPTVTYWTAILVLSVGLVTVVVRHPPTESPTPQLVLAPPATSTTAELKLTACRVMVETAFLKVTGRVVNLTGEPLANVIAVGWFYDARRGVWVTAQTPVAPPVVDAGSGARFEVVRPASPDVTAVSVSFRYPQSRPIEVRYPAPEAISKIVP